MQFPMIGAQIIVTDSDARPSGPGYRLMMSDVRHLLPNPCRSCSNASVGRNDTRDADVLHCSAPSSCSWLMLSQDVSEDDIVFVDETPLLGEVPSNSPCKECRYRTGKLGPAGWVNYCDRRPNVVNMELPCIVRGHESPSQWVATRTAREEAELLSELDALEAVEQKDYGTF